MQWGLSLATYHSTRSFAQDAVKLSEDAHQRRGEDAKNECFLFNFFTLALGMSAGDLVGNPSSIAAQELFVKSAC